MRTLASAWVAAILLTLAASPNGEAAASKPTSTPAPTPAVSPTGPGSSTDPLVLRLQQQIAQQAALDATKQSLAIEVAAAQNQKSQLAGVIAANQKAIEATLNQLATAEQHYHDASVRQASEHTAAVQARQQERADKAELAVYMRERYVAQDSLGSYILASSTISEMFGRAADVGHLMDRGEVLLIKVRDDARIAEAAEAAARKDADAAQLAATQLATQEQQLQAQTTQASQLMDQLTAQQKAAAQEIAAANQQSLAVAQDIAATRIAELDATIAAAEQADWQAASYWIQQHLGTLPGGITQPPPDTGGTPGAGHFAWPAPGSVLVQPFGPSPYPFEPPYEGYAHFHTGIDLTRKMGSPIVAAADGVVVVAGPSNVGYGNHIILAHDGGFMTLYGHLETMLVQPGDTVHQGQLIALMGSTGNSTGPHLHFEIRFNNKPVDPTPFLPPLPPGADGPPPIPGE